MGKKYQTFYGALALVCISSISLPALEEEPGHAGAKRVVLQDVSSDDSQLTSTFFYKLLSVINPFLSLYIVEDEGVDDSTDIISTPVHNIAYKPFDDLPFELLRMIMTYFNYKDFESALLVSKYWFHQANQLNPVVVKIHPTNLNKLWGQHQQPEFSFILHYGYGPALKDKIENGSLDKRGEITHSIHGESPIIIRKYRLNEHHQGNVYTFCGIVIEKKRKIQTIDYCEVNSFSLPFPSRFFTDIKKVIPPEGMNISFSDSSLIIKDGFSSAVAE